MKNNRKQTIAIRKYILLEMVKLYQQYEYLNVELKMSTIVLFIFHKVLNVTYVN